MALEKVYLLAKTPGSPQWNMVLNCSAQFNPEKLSVEKSAKWNTEPSFKSNIGISTYAGGMPQVLSVELFFDTTATGEDVRQYVDALVALTLSDVEKAKKYKFNTLQELKKNISDKEKAVKDLEKKRLDAQQWEMSLYKLSSSTGKYFHTQSSQGGLLGGIENLAKGAANMFGIDQMAQSLMIAGGGISGFVAEGAEFERRAEVKQLNGMVEQINAFHAGGEATPPICKFLWGRYQFEGVLESLNISYVMFLPDGCPVRAKVSIKLKQVRDENSVGRYETTVDTTDAYVTETGLGAAWMKLKDPGGIVNDIYESQRNESANRTANGAASYYSSM